MEQFNTKISIELKTTDSLTQREVSILKKMIDNFFLNHCSDRKNYIDYELKLKQEGFKDE